MEEGGLDNNYLYAAGNRKKSFEVGYIIVDDTTFTQYTNSRYTITIGALTNTG